MLRLAALLGGVVFLAATSTFAQSSAPQAYLVFLDYATFHRQLIARCASQYPETERALQTAIDEWTGKNQPAITELRVLLHERALRQGMNPKEADDRDAQVAAKVTSFMLNGVDNASASELRQTCSGIYAEQLSKPEMDYVALLQRAKEGQPR